MRVGYCVQAANTSTEGVIAKEHNSVWNPNTQVPALDENEKLTPEEAIEALDAQISKKENRCRGDVSK